MTISTEQEPPLVKGLPILGHLLSIKKEGIHFYERMFRENGDALRIKILNKTYYLFLHPDHNKEILVDKADTFIKGKQYRQLRLILGNGLLTSSEPQWGKQRRMLNPLFGKDAMNVLLGHISDVSLEKCSSYSTDEMNWTHAMFDYTIEVAVRSFFGSTLSEKEKARFNQASVDCIRRVSKRMANPLSVPLFIPTSENKKLKADLVFLKDTVLRIYNERKKSEIRSKDMLDMLISANDEDNSKFSVDDIFDQILTFLFAGHETTAMSMSWLFHELSKHPEVQNRIIEECERNNYSFESSLSLGQYPYLTSVLNETMRLYPAGWVIARDIAEDSTVGGFRVKKDRVLAICPFINHRDPRWWKNPLEFNPDRFNDEVTKNAFLPFSLGKRNCIGGRFAMIEMSVFCIHFFKHFTVQSQQQNVGLKGFVTLKPARPITVRLSKRTS